MLKIYKNYWINILVVDISDWRVVELSVYIRIWYWIMLYGVFGYKFNK